MTQRRVHPIAAAAVAFALIAFATAAAQAQLSVSPTSLLFADAETTKAITIENAGHREEAVRIAIVDLRMLPDGRMVPAEPPATGEQFADKLVRFSPHELRLAPGASQVVRLEVPPEPDRPPGEWRTHVLIQQIPETEALDAPPFAGGENVSVDLQAVFGVAVPLIIRSPTLEANVRIGTVRLQTLPDGNLVAALSLERSGERSVRGAVAVLLDGDVIGQVDGIAIYAPAQQRQLLVPLSRRDLPPSAHLEAQFTDEDKSADHESAALAH